MAKTLNISDEERALLTEEELQGMLEGEEFDEGEGGEEGEGEGSGEGEGEATAAESAAAGAATDEGKDKAGDTADDNAVAEAAAAQAAADAAAAASAAAGEANNAEVEDIASFTKVAAIPVSVLPADFDDKIKAIDDSKAALGTKLDEGDITTAEYHAQLDKLNKDERELERVKDRHDTSEQNRYSTWVNVHVDALMTRHNEYRTNDLLKGLLNQEVMRLQAGDAKAIKDGGTPKYASDTDPKILLDAHKRIAGELPSAFAAPAKAAAPKPKGKPASAPTLAHVPAADANDTSENEFGYLDGLMERDPSGYERALEQLARKDPAKYDLYMAS